MIKKIGLTLVTFMVTLVLSTSVIAAQPEGKGKPDNGKGPTADGVIIKKDGEAINTGKSDEEPGPSPG